MRATKTDINDNLITFESAFYYTVEEVGERSIELEGEGWELYQSFDHNTILNAYVKSPNSKETNIIYVSGDAALIDDYPAEDEADRDGLIKTLIQYYVYMTDAGEVIGTALAEKECYLPVFMGPAMAAVAALADLYHDNNVEPILEWEDFT